ncbi:MAG: hypothetical protein MK082_04940 [Phycisphaerales bacterium]|nr:hypothetical protein [Phycisphaerales bacterium]
MTTLLAASGMFACMSVANADTTYSSSWEDTNSPALLGTYGNVADYGYDSANYHDGSNSVFMMEDPLQSTPQGYLAWIHDLEVGDEVTVGIWAMGMDTGGTNSRGRLWHHYSDSEDITAYAGGGNGGTDTSYIGEGGEWTYGETTFTFTGDEGESMVIEGRVYAYGDNNMVWYDEMTITVNNDAASVEMAGVPAPGALALLGLGGLVARRRRA